MVWKSPCYGGGCSSFPGSKGRKGLLSLFGLALQAPFQAAKAEKACFLFMGWPNRPYQSQPKQQRVESEEVTVKRFDSEKLDCYCENLENGVHVQASERGHGQGRLEGRRWWLEFLPACLAIRQQQQKTSKHH